MKTSVIKSEEKMDVKMKCEVKQDHNSKVTNYTMRHGVVVKEESNENTKTVRLGAKAHWSDLPTAEDK
jgi:hypothetical protein